jgi:hypothetical protein
VQRARTDAQLQGGGTDRASVFQRDTHRSRFHQFADVLQADALAQGAADTVFQVNVLLARLGSGRGLGRGRL